MMRLWRIFLFVFPCWIGWAETAALPAPLTKLRVLLILDTHADGIEEGVLADGRRVRGFLDYLFKNPDFPTLRSKTVRITVLGDDEELTSKLIVDQFKTDPPQKDEAVFIYYSGHGSYKMHELGFGTPYLDLSNGESLLREDVAFQSEWRSPSTTFITDSCATVRGGFTSAIQLVTSKGSALPVGRRELVEQFYETLFFRHRGMTDFNSSTVAQPSWTLSVGSLMTYEMMQVLKNPDLDALDKDKNSVVTWEEVFGAIELQTNNAFKSVRAQQIAAKDLDPSSTLFKSKAQVPQLYAVGRLQRDAIVGFFAVPLTKPLFEVERLSLKVHLITPSFVGRKVRVNYFALAAGSTEPIKVGEYVGPASQSWHPPPVDVPYASLPASKKPLMLRVEMADAQTGDVLLKSYSVPVEFPHRANE